jgi:homocitrate synthase NifV
LEHLRLSDTAGVLTPGRTADLTALFVTKGFTVEFHAHNDLGLANANSLVSALNGASYVDTTLLGVGERAGNACLSRFLRMLSMTPHLESDLGARKAAKLEESFRPVLERDDYLDSLVRSKSSDITDLVRQYAGG